MNWLTPGQWKSAFRMGNRTYVPHNAALCLFVFVATCRACTAILSSGIEHIRKISTALSPDHKWRATITDFLEENGAFTVEIARLEISSTQDPYLKAELLNVDKGSGDEEFPLISWKSNNVLMATIYYLPDVYIRKSDFAGVHLEIKVNPQGEINHRAAEKYFKALRENNHPANAASLKK